jgi:hypothetical protein
LLKIHQAYTNQRAVVAYFANRSGAGEPWFYGPVAGPLYLFLSAWELQKGLKLFCNFRLSVSKNQWVRVNEKAWSLFGSRPTLMTLFTGQQ